jgi:hypothetical protein
MDELVIVGRVRKQVDTLLRHLLPVRVAQVHPDQAWKTGNITRHATGVSCAHASPRRLVSPVRLLSRIPAALRFVPETPDRNSRRPAALALN